jgi:regulator of RNase E activity RraA
MYPELGRTVGYAVTCVYGLPESAPQKLTFADVAEALEASLKPSILVFQQKFPPKLANKVGLSGGNMTSAMKALGCVGAISNGPSRDIDEIRAMNFQYMLSGISPGHGEMAVHAVNVEVSVAGMNVEPGDIIHMDENGACKFPASRLQDVVVNSRKLMQEEAERLARFRSATTAADVRRILEDLPYSKNR